MDTKEEEEVRLPKPSEGDDEGRLVILEDDLRVKDNKRQATHWCFTWFQESSDDSDQILNSVEAKLKSMRYVKQYCFQLELTGEQKQHVQGYVGFNRGREAFAELRRNFPGCHVEISRKWWNSVSYCCKKDTRVPGTSPRKMGIDESYVKEWGSVGQAQDVRETKGRKPGGKVAPDWERIKSLECVESFNLYTTPEMVTAIQADRVANSMDGGRTGPRLRIRRVGEVAQNLEMPVKPLGGMYPECRPKVEDKPTGDVNWCASTGRYKRTEGPENGPWVDIWYPT